MKPRNKRAGYIIGVTCPGCGSALELQSDFCTIECEHCRSVLRISVPADQPLAYFIKPAKDKRAIRFQLDRYLKKNNYPLTGQGYKFFRLFYPYWKIDGIVLRIRAVPGKAYKRSDRNLLTAQLDYAGLFQYGRALGKVLTAPAKESEEKSIVKLVPHSSTVSAGPELCGLPASLGMRTDYIKLYPFSGEKVDKSYTYLPSLLDWPDVKESLNRSIKIKSALFNSATKKADRIFGVTGSLIYFPYFIVQMAKRDEQSRFIFDGVSGRIVHVGPPSESDDFEQPPDLNQDGFGELDIVPHRCRTCGDDLPPDSSTIHICHNCQRVNLIGASDLFSGDINIISGGNPEDQLFPFWVWEQSLPQNISPSVPTKMVVPAFAISNFEVMRRLTQRVSVALPNFATANVTADDDRFRAVTLGPEEGFQMAEIIACCREASSAQWGSLSIDRIPGMMSLIYIPFHLRNYFFVDSIINTITFEKSAV